MMAQNKPVKILCTLVFLCLSTIAFGQPTNDDCINAIDIPNPVAFCSSGGAYTNISATPSAQVDPTCWLGGDTDVWFSFTAVAADVSIIAQSNANWGTMEFPEVAVYDGCTGTELVCDTDNGGTFIVQVFQTGLTIGQTYFIRVDSRQTQWNGTFKLCIDNYNSPPNVQSDCIDAVTLCTKDAFTVSNVVGIGQNAQEVDGTCVGSEFASAWYQWTCETSGSLTFTLTPNNIDDDLDFALYEFPNGLGDCNNKIVRRCMASGENVGQPSSTWVACTGATGLMLGDPDTEEVAGCQTGNNNFVQELNMVAGQSYVLMVNNFSNTGNGFSISFGGTGTFVGPEAEFTDDQPDTICVGTPISFTDISTFAAGNIVGWDWNFGLNAAPQTSITQNPSLIAYDRPGDKFVRLTVETDAGCIVTEVKKIVVIPCCNTVNQLDISVSFVQPICGRNQDGTITVSLNNNYSPHIYQWSDGNSSQNRTNLGAGLYTLTFTDAIGCDTILEVPITAPPFFQVDTLLQQPTCSGGLDGGVTLLVSGAVPDYDYNWSPVASTDSLLTNIGNGLYDVTITDAAGCDTSLTLRVWELELILDSLDDFLIQPLCYGDANGSITASMGNGAAPYQFNWNGTGNTTNNSIFNLTAGIYTVTVTDNNLCQGNFTLDLEQPDSLDILLEGFDVSCYDGDDGAITAFVTGSVGNYVYNWEDGQTDTTATNLTAGNYGVTVTDGNGCTIDDTTSIQQPPAIVITGIDIQNVSCFGGNDGQMTVNVTGGTPPFTYSIDNVNFQASNVIDSLIAGDYAVYIQDDLGCTFQDFAMVNQPWELMVDAGLDVTIDLGFTTDLLAFVNTLDSVTYTWTPSESLSCGDCKNPTARPIGTTTYTITAVNSTGCIAIDSVTVTVNLKKPLFVPNVITPNFDGVNDFFYIQGNPAIRTVRTLKIFDRWGDHIFRNENFDINEAELGWDGSFRGKPVNPGVYVYYIEVEFIDDEVVVLSGDVTVLR